MVERWSTLGPDARLHRRPARDHRRAGPSAGVERIDLTALAEEVVKPRRGGDTYRGLSAQPGPWVTGDGSSCGSGGAPCGKRREVRATARAPRSWSSGVALAASSRSVPTTALASRWAAAPGLLQLRPGHGADYTGMGRGWRSASGWSTVTVAGSGRRGAREGTRISFTLPLAGRPQAETRPTWLHRQGCGDTPPPSPARSPRSPRSSHARRHRDRVLPAPGQRRVQHRAARRRAVDEATGHEALVVAPGPGPDDYAGTPVVRVRSVGLPGYRSFPIGLPGRRGRPSLADFGPDVVHLASPIASGSPGLRAATRAGVPTVAVYQTDVAGFARQYGLHAEAVVDRVGRPSAPPGRPDPGALVGLAGPAPRRSACPTCTCGGAASRSTSSARRRRDAGSTRWSRATEVVVGYVGRLAAREAGAPAGESWPACPAYALVVVGDGPERGVARAPAAGRVFTGQLGGADLARPSPPSTSSSTPVESETFCQTVQEAQAGRGGGGPRGRRTARPGRPRPHRPALRPHRPARLLRAVVAAGARRVLRARLAEAGRAEVHGRSWPAVVDELVEQHYCAVARPARRAIA